MYISGQETGNKLKNQIITHCLVGDLFGTEFYRSAF